MRKHFVAGAYHLRRLPLGGKLSPEVTDEGATGLPNGAGEKFRWGNIRAPLFCFYKERLGTGSPPHPTRLRRPTFPPRGRLCAVLPFPSAKPPPPARPAGGRAVTGGGNMGRRPGRKKEDPLQGPLNQSRESRGGNLSPLALFPPVSREKRGPPPGRRPTGRCAPRLRKSPDHPKGTQPRPPHKRGIPRRVSPLFIPPLVGWNLSHFLPAR